MTLNELFEQLVDRVRYLIEKYDPKLSRVGRLVHSVNSRMCRETEMIIESHGGKGSLDPQAFNIVYVKEPQDIDKCNHAVVVQIMKHLFHLRNDLELIFMTDTSIIH